MFDGVARNVAGVQLPNSHGEIDSAPDLKFDNYTVMQDTAGSQIPVAEQEARNAGRPAPFWNLRWYDGDTTNQDPGIIAANATGWVEKLVADFSLDYNRLILQVMNENNIQQEHPDQPGSWDNFDSYVRMANWEFACMNYIRQANPRIKLGTLYLSPGHNEDQPGKVWDYKERLDKPGQGVYTIEQGLYRLVKNELPPELAPERDEEEVCVAFDIPEIRRNVEYADVLGTHFYWDRRDDGSAIGLYDWDPNSNWMARRFVRYHPFFPDTPIFISESNDNKGTNSDATRSQFIQEMVWYTNHLYQYSYIAGNTFFIWAIGTSHPNIYSEETISVFKEQDFPRVVFGVEAPPIEPVPPIIPPEPEETSGSYIETTRRLTPVENHGMHNIFFTVLDVNGRGKSGEVIRVEWPPNNPDGGTNLVTNSEGITDFVMYGENPEGLEAPPEGDYAVIFGGLKLVGFTARRWASDGDGNGYGHWSYEVIFRERQVEEVDFKDAVAHFIRGNFDSFDTRPIDVVVLHRAQGSLAGMDAWFNNPTSGVSAHYGVGLNGEIHQYVKDKDNAWHAGVTEATDTGYFTDKPRSSIIDGVGVSWNNYRSIGIELEGYVGELVPDVQLEAAARLTKDIKVRYNIKEVVAHSKLNKTRSDPGPTFDWTLFNLMVDGSSIVTEFDMLWAPYPFIPQFAIPKAWVASRVSGKDLGRPTTPEMDVVISNTPLVVQRFEKGTIVYFKTTGEVDIVYVT